MGEDLYLQRKSRSKICSAIEEEFERDCLGYRSALGRFASSRCGMGSPALLHGKGLMVYCMVAA